jgi:hypothetical protein
MRYLALVCMLLACLSGIAAADDAKPEEIIAKHLDSIGTAEARAAVKSRGIQGTLIFKILERGPASGDEASTGDATGIWGYVSEHVSEKRESNFVMKFGSAAWRGERFVFDGDKTSFAVFTSSHRPSSFGDFVRTQDFIITEGWLGGELSTGWALLNLDRARGKLNYVGLKKVDGHDLQCMEYVSKADEDMAIKVYFDPENHHHVMTVYSLVWAPGSGRNGRRATATAPASAIGGDQGQIRFTIEERFSDFQADSGLTLPRHYDLRFTREPQNGASRLYDFDMTADKFLTNIGLDPANFQIK